MTKKSHRLQIGMIGFISMSSVLYDGTDRIDYAHEKNGGHVVQGNQWTSFPPAHVARTLNPSIAINV